MPIGVFLLVAVLASVIAPPFYAVILAIESRYITGFVVFLVWLGWLRFGRRLLRWMLQGIEYAGV